MALEIDIWNLPPICGKPAAPPPVEEITQYKIAMGETAATIGHRSSQTTSPVPGKEKTIPAWCTVTCEEVESARPLLKECRVNCPSLETIAPVKRVQGNQLTEEHQAYFMAAWPWIKENRTQLMRAGWTMAELLRRAKYRWPLGPWGLAWLPIWSKPGLVVELGTKGEIIFTYHAAGRTIRQTAWPN